MNEFSDEILWNVQQFKSVRIVTDFKPPKCFANVQQNIKKHF